MTICSLKEQAIASETAGMVCNRRKRRSYHNVVSTAEEALSIEKLESVAWTTYGRLALISLAIASAASLVAEGTELTMVVGLAWDDYVGVEVVDVLRDPSTAPRTIAKITAMATGMLHSRTYLALHGPQVRRGVVFGSAASSTGSGCPGSKARCTLMASLSGNSLIMAIGASPESGRSTGEHKVSPSVGEASSSNGTACGAWSPLSLESRVSSWSPA